MASITINKDSIEFLKDLSKNNNREWFNINKDRYLQAQSNIIAFADALIIEMNRHDKIETLSGKESLFRIYKDVRFSKEKTPYNVHWSGALKKGHQKASWWLLFSIRARKFIYRRWFFWPRAERYEENSPGYRCQL